MTKEQTQIMQELLVYIDNAIDGKFRAAQAANEKSWFETQLDKIDNGWGAVGEKLGHDNIAGHKVVKKWEDMTSAEKHRHTAVGMAKSQKPVERWKPEYGDYYWSVWFDGGIRKNQWTHTPPDATLFAFGNVFRLKSEALAARDRVKKALKGE